MKSNCKNCRRWKSEEAFHLPMDILGMKEEMMIRI